MRATTEKIDLSLLPDAARQEVFDFYQFVAKRYGQLKKTRPSTHKKLPAEFYRPIMVKEYLTVTRDEIYNEIE